VLGFTLAPGQLLYEIDEREYLAAERKAIADVEKAKADIENWQAQIRLAEAELARVDMAIKAGVSSPTDLDKARAAVDVTKAQHTAAIAAERAAVQVLETARIQLGYTHIGAEISGRINRTLVTPGNLVGQTEATLLTTIVRVDELYVYFDVPEADLMAYQRMMAVTPQPDATSQQIPVEIGVVTEEGYPHVGRIDFRENRVETSTGTIRIRGRIPNPPEPTGARLLYPGLYAHVRVPRGETKPQPVIPEDCLMAGQEGRFVYVVRPDNTVEKRLVTVGPNVWREPPLTPGVVPPGWVLVNPSPSPGPSAAPNGPPPPTRRPVKSMVAITAGLTPGDRVMVDGVQKTRPGGTVVPEQWVLTPPGSP
jgi:membrane fusion protein, multidrug efflux system